MPVPERPGSGDASTGICRNQGRAPPMCLSRTARKPGSPLLWIGLIQRPALDEVFQLPLTPHGKVPLSPITGLEERRAHDATGTAITVSYLAAGDTDAGGGPSRV